MKEYRSRNYGRFIFNEDMHNLQALALSMTEMFKDSGLNFVISGCEISIDPVSGSDAYTISVSSGYAFLENRIKPVSAFTYQIDALSSIYSIGLYSIQPTAPQITYVNGDTDYQYDDYSAEVRVNYTSETTEACILATGYDDDWVFPNLRTAFFAHYGLVNNGTQGVYSERSVFLNGIETEYANIVELKIDGTDFEDYANEHFVSKAGDTMDADASLVFSSSGKLTTITGALISTTGNISAANITGTGNATISGTMTAATAAITGNLTANNATIANDFNANNLTATAKVAGATLEISGSAKANNMTVDSTLTTATAIVTGRLNVQDDASVAGNLTVSNNTSIDGTLTVTNNVNASGSVSAVGSISGSGGQIGGNGLNVSGSTNLTGQLTVNNVAIFYASAQVKNGLNVIDGGLTVTLGNVTIDNGDTVMKKNLTVAEIIRSENSIIAPTITAESSLVSNGTITATGAISGDSAAITQEITAGSCSLSGGLSAETVRSAYIYVAHEFTTPNLTVSDTATINSLISNAVSTNSISSISNLTISGNPTFTDLVTFNSTTIFLGNIEIGSATDPKQFYVYGDIEASRYLSASTKVTSPEIDTTTIKALNSTTGLIISNKMTVSGDVIVNGGFTVGSDENTKNAKVYGMFTCTETITGNAIITSSIGSTNTTNELAVHSILRASYDASVKGNFSVGTEETNRNMYVYGNMYSTNSIQASTSITGPSVYVSSICAIDSSVGITVNSNTTITGSLTVGSQSSPKDIHAYGDFTVSDTLGAPTIRTNTIRSISGSSVTFDGGISADGVISALGGLTGTTITVTTVNATNMSITGTATVSNLTVSTSISVQNMTASNRIETSYLNVSTSMYAQAISVGNLSATSSISTQNFTVTGTVKSGSYYAYTGLITLKSEDLYHYLRFENGMLIRSSSTSIRSDADYQLIV